ncbi:hypothetical protein H4R34_000193 [Dimargaris verticillata]|uniref:Hypervirulence associated protein TUDOR domain-containing protein n=1 Tax=Dimargaris verticillata TaxID=2761393 RepID=A0A9W8EFK9_9FUNG|nr:hypothetical protein H4R34_000193 [Dimargaris verticillata]
MASNKAQGQREMFTIGDHVMYHPSGNPKKQSKGVIRDIAIQSAFQGQTKPGHPEHWNQEHHRFLVEDDVTGEQCAMKVESIEKKI